MTGIQHPVDDRNAVESASSGREAILIAMRELVSALGRALGPNVEVVLHDLGRLPNSVVAISNPVTGRTVGDPPTDLLLRDVREGRFEDRYRYRSTSAPGTDLRSSTMFIRDANGLPIATLCINQDVTDLARFQEVLDRQLGGSGKVEAAAATNGAGPPASESFAHGVPHLAEVLIEQAISDVGVPVDLMKKSHKLLVVRHLEERGFFLIREAVEDAAAALGVTRYTIYNYLNELQTERTQADGAATGRNRSG